MHFASGACPLRCQICWELMIRFRIRFQVRKIKNNWRLKLSQTFFSCQSFPNCRLLWNIWRLTKSFFFRNSHQKIILQSLLLYSVKQNNWHARTGQIFRLTYHAKSLTRSEILQRSEISLRTGRLPFRHLQDILNFGQVVKFVVSVEVSLLHQNNFSDPGALLFAFLDEGRPCLDFLALKDNYVTRVNS